MSQNVILLIGQIGTSGVFIETKGNAVTNRNYLYSLYGTINTQCLQGAIGLTYINNEVTKKASVDTQSQIRINLTVWN